MKKIFLLALLFIPVFVSGETFYAGSDVTSVPIYVDKITKKSYRYFKTAYRSSDNVLVYCVEPEKLLSVTADYQKNLTAQQQHLNISSTTWQRLEELAYFGYGYENHTDLKWAAITQFLIWQTVLPENWFISFTDGYGGSFKNVHEKEVNEIENLIEEFNVLPSFQNKTYNVSKNGLLNLRDTNLAFQYYDIVDDSQIDYQKTNNEIKFNTSKNGTYKLSFRRNEYKATPLYTSVNNQSVIATDGVLSKQFALTINITSGNLKITRKHDNWLSNEGSNAGAKYEILDSNGTKWYKETNEDGEIILNDLPIGKAIINEITPSLGYEKDLQSYEINIVNNEKTQLIIEPRLIKKPVNIQKFYLNGNEIIPEEGAEFTLNKDQNVLTFVTNRDGIALFELPFGNYLLKQTKTLPNYQLAPDQFINVEDNKKITLYFLNKKIEEKEIENPPKENLPSLKEKFDQKNSLNESKFDNHESHILDNNVYPEIINPKTNDNIFYYIFRLVVSIILLLFLKLNRKNLHFLQKNKGNC